MTLLCGQLQAQGLLQMPVTIEAHNRPLEKVLDTISKQGRFIFSYNSNLIKADSLVTLSVKNKTVKQVLDLLFNETLQYNQSGSYLILQPAAHQPNSWYVTGYIEDAVSGEKLNNTSIYDRNNLVGTITDEHGFFKLKLKEKGNYPPQLAISISRISYADTAIIIRPGQSYELTIAIQPISAELDPLVLNSKIEKGWIAHLFITPAQSIQSLNLRNFFASKPVQFSLTPGLGSHGNMSTQVVNKFSFNVLGGYTAGTRGLEVAGLFNINKKDAKYVQVAGINNAVGGKVEGLQVAGIHNHVQDSVKGLQVAGIVNTSGAVKGMQVAGIANITDSNITGFQVAGIANIVKGSTSGLQVAGILNRTRRLKGLQVGLINIADTLDGCSLALVTITKSGYHKMLVIHNSLMDVNLAYKAGNKKLYSLVMGGINTGSNRKAYSYGYGFGTEIALNNSISWINEITAQHIYNGQWQEIYSYQPALQMMLGKRLGIIAGPVLYVGNPKAAKAGYVETTPAHSLFSGNATRGWLGWQVGVQLF
ncbi:hypothetical protein FLA_5857 [Filimonas lacunae]|nr:hypothetical protein FLA_5857 [Filimonas lacunae]